MLVNVFLAEFVDNLNRDRARGTLAPHQIILLMSLSKIYRKGRKKHLDILTLNEVFQKVWQLHKNEFKTTNNKLGLPLKAFVNKGYLTINTSDEIKDFRNQAELEAKIIQIVLEDILINQLKTDQVEEYLITRISR